MAALRALETLRVCLAQGHLRPEDNDSMQADRLYGIAVGQLSEDLPTAMQSPAILFVTVLLLTAVELLQRRRQDGLKHGYAFAKLSSFIEQSSEDENIDHLSRMYDLASLLYSDGVRMPILQTAEDTYHENLEQHSIRVLHHTHAFIARLHHESTSDPQPSSNEEVQTHIDSIQLLFHKVQRQLLDTEKPTLLLLVQNLCRMTTLQLGQLFARDEISWDVYHNDFEAIIAAAEAIKAWNPKTSRQFTLLPAIIPPLQLVALKCRYRQLRTKAICMLNEGGCEGPFAGTQIAAMASRCMKIEERDNKCPIRSASDQQPVDRLPPEEARVTKCALIDSGHQDQHISNLLAGTTTIRILRRRRPGPSIQAYTITSTSFRESCRAQSLPLPQVDPDMWDQWTETISYGRQM